MNLHERLAWIRKDDLVRLRIALRFGWRHKARAYACDAIRRDRNLNR